MAPSIWLVRRGEEPGAANSIGPPVGGNAPFRVLGAILFSCRIIRIVGFAALLGLLSMACAPRQQVPLAVYPPDAELFLDGEVLEQAPEVLDLRSDRDHTLFVKSSGYQSELVVLRSLKRPEKGPELAPESVAVRLKSLDPSGRELVIEEAEAP